MSTESKTKSVVVTGGNAGLGFFSALQLAKEEHRVYLASRNSEKAYKAIDYIKTQVPTAQLDFISLDLADSKSIHQAAKTISELPELDAILLNAGVVGSNKEKFTADGFELQIGTNHLGHWSLVSQILPRFLNQNQGRIVHLGSISHRWVRIPKNRLIPENYSNPVNYALSKLAVMTFGFELANRLKNRGSKVESVVAHPGFSWDAFNEQTPEFLNLRKLPSFQKFILTPLAQGKDQGAKSLVEATVSSKPQSGDYWGPSGFFQLKGVPAKVPAKKHSRSSAAADRLWQFSKELTGLEPNV